MRQEGISDGNLPVDFVVESDDEEEEDNAISSPGGKKKRRKKRGGAHQSTLPSALLDQLNELDAESDDEDYVLDDMFVTNETDDLAAKQVEKEMEEALKRMQDVANGADIVKSAIGDVGGDSDQKAMEAMAELQGTLNAASADVTDAGMCIYLFVLCLFCVGECGYVT